MDCLHFEVVFLVLRRYLSQLLNILITNVVECTAQSYHAQSRASLNVSTTAAGNSSPTVQYSAVVPDMALEWIYLGQF